MDNAQKFEKLPLLECLNLCKQDMNCIILEEQSVNLEIQDESTLIKLDEYENKNLVKRPQTASPYVMAVKYRNKAKMTNRKSNRIIIKRQRSVRRKTSEGESIYGNESQHTNTSYTDYFDEFNEEFDFEESDFDNEKLDILPNNKQREDSVTEELESRLSSYLEICTPLLSEQENEIRGSHEHSSYCENQYRKMCKHLNITPVSSFIRELSTRKVVVRHRSLCSKGAKAIAVALLENGYVQVLDMTDNEIGPVGASYLAEMLADNRIITDLNLSDNKLGIDGAKHILDIATESDNFERLNLSGNDLREFDAIHLTKLFEDTHNLQKLNLSHNEFREFGGKVIGQALKINDTIEELDLSWNHLRFAGADAVADGLAVNQGIKKLDISWNGFSIRGCQKLASALQLNDTLTELNLECNRINKEALEKLLKGFKDNQTLETLKLGWNPITTKGAQLILDFINENQTTALKQIDIRTQLVEKPFSENVKKLKTDRQITIVHGMIRGDRGGGDDEDELSLIDENPIIVLMEFGHMNGFRLTDLFSVFDKDGSKSLDKSEIKTGLMELFKMAGIPLQEKCLNILIDKLDDDDSGEIEYAEMMQAQMIHRKEKAKMMRTMADNNIDLEKTEVGRVRGKLQKLMAKHMDGNPAFKRRVEEFKKMLASSKKDEQLKAEFEKKMALRRQSRIEKEKKIEIRKAKEEALNEIIEADMVETQMSFDKSANLGKENIVTPRKENSAYSENQKVPPQNKTPRSEQGEKDWIAVHV